jgi:hypothetical protein
MRACDKNDGSDSGNTRACDKDDRSDSDNIGQYENRSQELISICQQNIRQISRESETNRTHICPLEQIVIG